MHGEPIKITMDRFARGGDIIEAVNAVMVQDAFADRGFLDVLGMDNVRGGRGDSAWEVTRGLKMSAEKKLPRQCWG